ncbi:hypothetical protein [Nocardia sp. BMG51109]|uniref:hypothetical protein n=1 Tax=Nocardia sp. BMG51109 TaxID=1056816 RepID=UPI0004641F83|nr:hypothetical protein [Nocardia sp. BMG51109]
MTFGVSTERGAVQAVALGGGAGGLPERILHHRTRQFSGDDTHGLVRAVGAVLDDLAAELGPDDEAVGAAVTYRDAAERRAIVTGLASGPWRAASLVSAKSAHLALARAMTWVDEFGHLVICEVVPGYQGFSLISPERDRVVAGLTAAGGTVTRESMRPSVTAAWDQFEAAGVRPDAVVLVGSAAGDPAVASALGTGFGASIVPCKVAQAGSAIGAALVARPEAAGAAEAGGRARLSRRTTAVFAAAGVLAGGLAVVGVHQMTGKTRTDAAVALTDSRVAAQAHRGRPAGNPVPHPILWPEPDQQQSANPGAAPGDSGSEVFTVDPAAGSEDAQDSDRLGVRGFDSEPSDDGGPLVRESDPHPAPAASPSVPSAPNGPVGAPNGSLLFPGEPTPPQIGTAEFGRWWDNHWRMMTQWAAQMMPRT